MFPKDFRGGNRQRTSQLGRRAKLAQKASSNAQPSESHQAMFRNESYATPRCYRYGSMVALSGGRDDDHPSGVTGKDRAETLFEDRKAKSRSEWSG